MTDDPKPLDEWPTGWLKLEVAQLLRNLSYLIMTRDEKLDQDLPVTDAEMRAFILKKREELSK